MFININDDIVEFGDLVSVELFGQLCDNINHLIDAMPIGSIVPIMHGFPGVPLPDTDIWKECDGTLIDDPLSPLRNTLAPDYSTDGRYMRMYNTIGEVGNYGGSNSRDLSHNHGGQTNENASMADNADTDNDFWTGKNHRHSISSDLGIVNMEPEHLRIKHYIKINNTIGSSSGKFRDLEKDFGTSISQALWIKAANGVNSMSKSYPVGMLLFMINSQDNLPATPNSIMWMACDGSTVTNPLSPLFGQVLPDLRGKFLRHPTNIDAVMSFGGQPTVTLTHSHGGQTGSTSDRNDLQMDGGGERYEAGDHQHSIGSAMGTYDVTLYNLEHQIYVRIL